MAITPKLRRVLLLSNSTQPERGKCWRNSL